MSRPATWSVLVTYLHVGPEWVKCSARARTSTATDGGLEFVCEVTVSRHTGKVSKTQPVSGNVSPTSEHFRAAREACKRKCVRLVASDHPGRGPAPLYAAKTVRAPAQPEPVRRTHLKYRLFLEQLGRAAAQDTSVVVMESLLIDALMAGLDSGALDGYRVRKAVNREMD